MAINFIAQDKQALQRALAEETSWQQSLFVFREVESVADGAVRLLEQEGIERQRMKAMLQ
jgi:hypothetical protein